MFLLACIYTCSDQLTMMQVGAQSITMAQCLADLHPGLRLVVQINNMPSTVPLADRLVPAATRGGEPDTPASTHKSL